MELHLYPDMVILPDFCFFVYSFAKKITNKIPRKICKKVRQYTIYNNFLQFIKKCLHYLNISYIFIFLQISFFINIFVYFKLFTIPSIIFRSEGKYIFAPILFNINAVTKLAPRIPFIKFGSLEYCSFKAFKLTFFNKFSLFL